MFNGAPELAVQAVDSVHQRALYELYADVILVCFFNFYFISSLALAELLSNFLSFTHFLTLDQVLSIVLQVTNSISETLLESNFHKNEELLTAHWVRPGKLDSHKGSEVVTNASLRLKKMPEDISPVVDDDMKGFNFSDSKYISLVIFCSLLSYFVSLCRPVAGKFFIVEL